MSYVKYTKTSTFLFPLLGISKNIFNCNVKSTFGKQIMTNRFLNSYMIDSDLQNKEYNLGPYIFLVVRSYMDSNFESFHNTLTAYEFFINEYERSDFKVFIFRIPDEFLSDYSLFKKGHYSKISSEGKQLIIKNAFFKTRETLPLILSKNEFLKEKWEKRLSVDGKSSVELGNQEVWPIYRPEKETFSAVLLDELSKKSKISPNKKEFK